MKNKFLIFVILLKLIFLNCARSDPLEGICIGLNNVALPHPEFCNKFVLCINEYPFVNVCDPPKEFFYEGECVAGKVEINIII